MTIPSLRLIRHVRPVFSINALSQLLPFSRLTARELCQTPKIEETQREKNAKFERLVHYDRWKGPVLTQLPFSEDMKTMLKKCGYHRMSVFQKKLIPVLMKGKNAIIVNETGSGKTLCYILSIVNAVYTEELPKNTNRPVEPSVVILTPSRENGLGIYRKTRGLLKDDAARVAVEFGTGEPYSRQTDEPAFLKDGCDIFISSPVRLQELIKDNLMSLNGLKVLVVDDLGQIAKTMIQAIKNLEIKHPHQMIVAGTSVRMDHQMLSIMPPLPVWKFKNLDMKAPKAISQHFRLAADKPMSRSRLESLVKELENMNPSRGIIFCNTIEMVKCLESELYHRGFNTTPFHGQQKHYVRRLSVTNFYNDKSQILVATPIACCIDFTGVDFVINYELPVSVSIYLHQIGRCGRMSKPGTAVTFASRKEVKNRNYFLQLLITNELTEAKKLFFPEFSFQDFPEHERELNYPNSIVDEEENNNAEVDKTQIV